MMLHKNFIWKKDLWWILCKYHNFKMILKYNQRKEYVKNKYGFGKNGKMKINLRSINLKFQV